VKIMLPIKFNPVFHASYKTLTNWDA